MSNLSIRKKKRRIFTSYLIGLIGLGMHSLVQADSLLQVYQQAISNDPSFKQAQANWLAAKEQLPIAFAALLPNLNAQGNIAYNSQNYTPEAAFGENNGYKSSDFQLNLTQSVFNWAVWKNLQAANATVKAATANFYFAQQDLIARTVKAYLSVLQAVDILKSTRANKTAFAEEYDTAKEKFDVGLVPISDVYDAQAKYDQAAAQELANINTLNDAIEILHEITGQYYKNLDGLGKQGIPLIAPTPNDIDAWSKISAEQNYQLKAQHFNTEAAKANIGVQFAGHLPSVGIQGTFSDQRQYERKLLLTGQAEEIKYQLGTIALAATLPIYSGGSVAAETRQARYNYASASAQEEVIYRQVVGQTRQAFLGVLSESAQIKADMQSITSAESALQSARAGYSVGVRTMLDVLNDTTQLYQARKNFAVDQYSYMNNFVTLKEAAGTLTHEDVVKLSAWLNKPINLQVVKEIPTSSMPRKERQPTLPPETISS